MEAPLPEDLEALRPFELKAELKRRGLAQTGSKAEMVERMRQAYDTQGPPDEAEGGPPEADGEGGEGEGEEQQEQQSALRIQAGWRGATGRREAAAKAKARAAERSAQAAEVAEAERVRAEEDTVDALRRECEDEGKAVAEALYQQKLAALEAERQAAAALIQGRFRVVRGQRIHEQAEAAVVIQASYRARLARRPRQFSLDSDWGRRFIRRLGPSPEARAARGRPRRHEESGRDYLRRLILPRLEAALRAADAARPDEPASFVAASLRAGVEAADTASDAPSPEATDDRRPAGARLPSSVDYIAQLRNLPGLREGMGKCAAERPDAPWDVVADAIEQAARGS